MGDRTGTDAPRRILGWVTLSVDGYAAGPDNNMFGSPRTPAAPRNRDLATRLDTVEEIVFLAPVMLGVGLRFFQDGLPASDWRLINVATFPTWDVALRYGRV